MRHLLVLALIGCESTIEIDTGDDVEYPTNWSGFLDGDEDGYASAVDCDETNSEIHPGAVDDTVDGIDQDCDGVDGGDVVDADGDGYTNAVDCDDNDPTVYPGAPDELGDGVDSDCDGVDGESNSADSDGDGWASEGYGGPDCDDGDPDIYPGAEETVGDGIDSNCDGADHGIEGLDIGDLVITEIMYDPFDVLDADGEWFEVHNATDYSVNLTGLTLADDPAFDPDDISTIDVNVVAEPGERLVFTLVANTEINGGITADYGYSGSGVTLNNIGDDLYLGIEEDDGTMTIIDSVVYNELEGWPEARGTSIELDGSQVSADANDSPESWCIATATAGSNTDLGSPGAPNSGC